jgi:hypothetical protein
MVIEDYMFQPMPSLSFPWANEPDPSTYRYKKTPSPPIFFQAAPSKAIQAQQIRWLANHDASRSLERLKFGDWPHLEAKNKTPLHFGCKTVSTTKTPPANPCDHDKSRELPNRVLAPGIDPKT